MTTVSTDIQSDQTFTFMSGFNTAVDSVLGAVSGVFDVGMDIYSQITNIQKEMSGLTFCEDQLKLLQPRVTNLELTYTTALLSFVTLEEEGDSRLNEFEKYQIELLMSQNAQIQSTGLIESTIKQLQYKNVNLEKEILLKKTALAELKSQVISAKKEKDCQTAVYVLWFLVLFLGVTNFILLGKIINKNNAEQENTKTVNLSQEQQEYVQIDYMVQDPALKKKG